MAKKAKPKRESEMRAEYPTELIRNGIRGKHAKRYEAMKKAHARKTH